MPSDPETPRAEAEPVDLQEGKRLLQAAARACEEYRAAVRARNKAETVENVIRLNDTSTAFVDAEAAVRDYAVNSLPALISRIESLQAEGERLRQAVGDLLAVIHRDGGHYLDAHGLEKALRDAQAVVLADRRVAPSGDGITQEGE